MNQGQKTKNLFALGIVGIRGLYFFLKLLKKIKDLVIKVSGHNNKAIKLFFFQKFGLI